MMQEESGQQGLIYKVVDADIWAEAIANGKFSGEEVDLADGYIHFSTANQLAETLEKHFSGRHNLVLVAVHPHRLENLKWEPSRGGDLFPHLYGELDVNFAESAVDLPVGKDGKHVLPEELG